MKIEVIIEKNKTGISGSIDRKGDFFPVTVGKNLNEVLQNLKALIAGYQKNEGKDDKAWKKINIPKIEWDIRYDIQAFFQQHDYLNISAIARRSGINENLLRHYAAGIKNPSAIQTRKIEDAIHLLADELKAVGLFAA